MSKAYEGNQPFIFVSYAHDDDDVVLPIIYTFQEAGYRIWYDDGIEWGDDEWPECIGNHVYSCSKFIAVMSRAAAQSEFCRKEIYLACKYKKQILVVYIEDINLDEINRGLSLQLVKSQAIRRHNFESDEAFIAALLKSPKLQKCIDCGFVNRRDAKRKPCVLRATRSLRLVSWRRTCVPPLHPCVGCLSTIMTKMSCDILSNSRAVYNKRWPHEKITIV